MNSLPGDLFARALRQTRLRLGISQAELARRMGERLGMNVDNSAITRIEQQTRAVRLDEAVAAAAALGVPLIALVSEDATQENASALRERIAELAAAEQRWDQQGQDVVRLSREVQLLTAEQMQLDDHSARIAPAADGDYELDPEHKAAIDARVKDPGA
ncbi:helix-turn-helix protein [Promicromonospora sp. AC04]|uniref:helix-turn-helix domain-containing protein n=1 Tax=Promicromonospora sp. AC04 TaxID=2135723 RepID=UPI000D3BA8FB|nr:helix-turn-helix transcriptional regulator [Promicromonospora sp. AC04]PUB32476.1 helix-turn-helix protein [Promicromonospora sp. AC04]